MRRTKNLHLLLLGLAGCAAPAAAPAPHPAEPPPSSETAVLDASGPAAQARRQGPLGEDHLRVRAVLAAPERDILLDAERFEVFRIVCERDPMPGEPAFQRYPVRARAELTKFEERLDLLEALYRGLIEAESFAFCFEPHHALRATRGGVRVEVVICFACNQLRVHGPSGDSGGSISDAAEPALRRLLGEVDDRLFAGRTLRDWIDHLTERYQDDPSSLAPEDVPGVEALAEAVSWSRLLRYEASDVLGSLGPRAAPAVPALVRALRGESPDAWRAAAQALATFGGAARPAVPGIAAALSRDLSARADAESLLPDQIESLKIDLMSVLEAIGPAARSAVPTLRRIFAGGDPTLSDAAAGALAAIRRDS